MLARGLVDDRGTRRLLCALADENDTGGRNGLEPRRGIDDVTGDHALAHSTGRDGRLAGQHGRTQRQCLITQPQLAHLSDEVQRSSNGPLRIIFTRDRRAPHRHDGVADELLDAAAVAFDDLPRHVEVARQQIARLFRVALLGQRRETDDVGEKDRNEASFRGWCRRLRARSGAPCGRSDARTINCGQLCAAFGTELLARLVWRGAVWTRSGES